jgi:hypothetical protein
MLISNAMHSSLTRESLIMKKLLHPNVRRIFFAWKEERRQIKLAKKHSVFIAQELCEWCDHLC